MATTLKDEFAGTKVEAVSALVEVFVVGDGLPEVIFEAVRDGGVLLVVVMA